MYTVIIKGTNSCNMACHYCSLGKKEHPILAGQKLITDIFLYSCRKAISKKETKIKFILHGGEPTLIPVEYYESAIKAADTNYPNLTKDILLQTNGLHISKAYMEFFKKYQVGVGISLDGPSVVHDNQRRDAANNTTYTRITDNIHILEQNGIHVSCLMVLTRNSINSDFSYLDYFRSTGIHLKINPLLNYGEAYEHPELSIEPGEYAEYLKKLFEFVIANDVDVSISPLDKILTAILTDNPITECTFNPKCNELFLCIDYMGDIYPCGKYADLHSNKIGNIYSLDCNLEHEVIDKLVHRRTVSLPKKCQSCSFVSLCHAGCNAEASINNRFFAEPLSCKDYILLFNYFKTDGLWLLKQYLIKKRKELADGEI